MRYPDIYALKKLKQIIKIKHYFYNNDFNASFGPVNPL